MLRVADEKGVACLLSLGKGGGAVQLERDEFQASAATVRLGPPTQPPPW